jgi:hypothetical protein
MAIGAGGGHNLGLRSNGTIVAWGSNSKGQTNIPPGLSNVLAVAGGYQHSLALRGSGVPFFVAQPADVTVAAGSQATFSVVASGFAPMTYQWQFNGSNLPGQTGPTLNLSNVQPGQAGSYRVIVTTPGGSATSQPATLTVGNAGPRFTSIEPLPGGFIRLRLTDCVGSSCRVERSAGLTSWTTVATFNNVTGSLQLVDAPPGGGRTWFYRAILTP